MERQKKFGWGDAVVETLAKDIQKVFPNTTGFSVFNLWRMRQFYMVHSSPEFLAQAVREIAKGKKSKTQFLAQAVPELLATIPWGHHVELLKKIKAPAAYLYYSHACAKFGWSRPVLLNQIKAGAYERALKEKKTHNFPTALPEYLAEQADETLKSSYNLEFLGIKREVKERKLEDKLIERVREFILELGYGFCFLVVSLLTISPKFLSIAVLQE